MAPGQILIPQLAPDPGGDQHISRMRHLQQRCGPVHTLHEAPPTYRRRIAKKSPHVLAALQCLDQRRADHDAVHVRRKARDLLRESGSRIRRRPERRSSA